MKSNLVIEGRHVRELLLNAGIILLSNRENETIILDSQYYTPLSEDWIMGQCREAFLDNCFSEGITAAEIEDGDCNNFCLWLMADITRMHRRTADRPYPRAAAGVGRMNTTLDSGQDHQVMVFIIGKDGVLSVRFLNAQPSVYGFVDLSQTELEAARNIRMA
jgi:hypothetical protein